MCIAALLIRTSTYWFLGGISAHCWNRDHRDTPGLFKETPFVKQTLAAALDARGYDTLTAVQLAVSDPDLQGRDMLVSAQTGSGKTLGFGLAIAPQILGDGDHFERAAAPLALVIAPTRELALQVKRELAWLFEKAGAVVSSTVGGMDMRDERRALSRGSHIVVATPGRLRDHIMRESIDLSNLKAVVLDEADEMLDLGFREDLEFILEAAPEERQTLLFSATVPNAIAKLAKSYQKDAERIAAASGASQHADIEYHAYQVAPRDGENAIINVLRYYEAPNAIVFCNTRAMVNRLTTRLSNRGFSVVALSGELSQNERTHALQAMRDGRARVCVATDVAARGIDLPNLDLVIHAELPSNQETLLHRSGRTGRAGRKGSSAMIVPPAQRKKAERLLGWAKLSATWGNAPGAEAVSAKDEERMVNLPTWSDPVEDADQSTVETLTGTFSTEQLAAAFLRLYREKHTAPEELSAIGEHTPRKPREAFGPSIWFALEGGRAARAEPRRLLPMFCKMGNISKDDIGAIRIQQDASYVEIRKDAVAGFVKAVGSEMVMEEGAKLSQLDGAPKLDAAPPRKKPGKFDDREKPSKPKREKPNTSAPIDWNDDPAPKVKKPKPGAKPAGKKPGQSPKREKTIAEPWKPRKEDGPKGKTDKPSGGKPKAKAGKPGGLKTPVGKPNSKKNKARRAAAAAGAKQGGNTPPKRKG